VVADIETLRLERAAPVGRTVRARPIR